MHANNEALTLIFMLTIAHFIVYTPYPVLWALRASAGGIFSKESSSFLIGIPHIWSEILNFIYTLIPFSVFQRIASNLATMVNVWDFYFYLKIPSFRQPIVYYLTCAPFRQNQSILTDSKTRSSIR